MVPSDSSDTAVTSVRRSSTNGTGVPDETEYFDVPFENNGIAKAHGLKWDPLKHKWFAPSAESAEKYRSATCSFSTPEPPGYRVYFNVHFLQRERAKELGMQFDGLRKKWFAPTAEVAARSRVCFAQLNEIDPSGVP